MRGQLPGRSWVRPQDVGLDIPAGPITPGDDRIVQTVNADGQTVLAKVVVQVGDQQVLLLPDGALATRRTEEVQVTDKKFLPLTADEMMKRLAAGGFSGFNIKKTRHYVYVYNTSEEFALVASRILESMIPGMVNYAKQQKIAAEEPPFPLVAVMFRTRQQFDEYQRMPQGVVAYYHVLSNQVVMYEESPLWRIKPELAVQQSIATIAHEGAHQILHNIGVQQRLSVWPMWLSEGLAEYFAPTSFGKNLRWKGPGQVNDLRMFELETYLKGRAADVPNGQMVEHTIAAARLTSTGYASAWSLVHYLARNERDSFHDLVREVSQLRPLEGGGEVVEPGIVPRHLELFRQHFGMDLPKLEERLVKHLKALPYADPFGEWPHFVATVEVPQGRRIRRDANLFHSPEMATKWADETIAALPDDQRPAARKALTPFPNRTAAERFARQYLGPAGK